MHHLLKLLFIIVFLCAFEKVYPTNHYNLTSGKSLEKGIFNSMNNNISSPLALGVWLLYGLTALLKYIDSAPSIGNKALTKRYGHWLGNNYYYNHNYPSRRGYMNPRPFSWRDIFPLARNNYMDPLSSCNYKQQANEARNYYHVFHYHVPIKESHHNNNPNANVNTNGFEVYPKIWLNGFVDKGFDKNDVKEILKKFYNEQDNDLKLIDYKRNYYYPRQLIRKYETDFNDYGTEETVADTKSRNTDTRDEHKQNIAQYINNESNNDNTNININNNRKTDDRTLEDDGKSSLLFNHIHNMITKHKGREYNQHLINNKQDIAHLNH